MTEEASTGTYPSGLPRPQIPLSEAHPELLIVTGMSGAGKSKAADVASDLGWYVVDNLPPSMLVDMVGVATRMGHRRLAAVVDVRGGRLFADLQEVLDDFASGGIDPRIVFLEASDEVLVRRFEFVRRPHPLQGEGTLLEGIRKERQALEEIRDRSDIVIDTSDTTVHEFAARFVSELGEDNAGTLLVNLVSFGFRNGIPVDADFVADVRFLDNPHWVPELRAKTGLDRPVSDRVLSSDGAQDFLSSFTAVLNVVLSRYRAHDRHAMAVAVGCTGGRHRSVAIVEEMAQRLKDLGHTVRTSHRDMDRDV